MLNAQEALCLWAEAMLENGQNIPSPRSLTDLKADAEVAGDLQRYMIALIPFPDSPARARPSKALEISNHVARDSCSHARSPDQVRG